MGRQSGGIAVAVAMLALLGCGGGSDASESAFVEGCVSSSNLDRAICECAGKLAKEELSEDGFALLVATFNEDAEAAAAVRSRLDMAEAMAAGMFMAQAPARCAAEQN